MTEKKLKLSHAQLDTLIEVVKNGSRGSYMVDYYKPAQKLLEYGFIKRVPIRALGTTSMFVATEAGIAKYEEHFQMTREEQLRLLSDVINRATLFFSMTGRVLTMAEVSEWADDTLKRLHPEEVATIPTEEQLEAHRQAVLKKHVGIDHGRPGTDVSVATVIGVEGQELRVLDSKMLTMTFEKGERGITARPRTAADCTVHEFEKLSRIAATGSGPTRRPTKDCNTCKHADTEFLKQPCRDCMIDSGHFMGFTK